MARSKHTRPDRIRAAARVRAPYASRGGDDTSTEYAARRALKEWGVAAVPAAAGTRAVVGSAAPLPRLRRQRPRPGREHPIGTAEIAAVLRFFGERCTYGLRSVELVRGGAGLPGGALLLGRLIIPGRVVLYDQPPAPWTLPGRLAAAERARLRCAGAIVETAGAGVQTIIAWPRGTLHDFVLFDVLLHEIGHHLLQQYTGKRRARIARTRDHEAFADHFARHCRLRYAGRRAAGADGG